MLAAAWLQSRVQMVLCTDPTHEGRGLRHKLLGSQKYWNLWDNQCIYMTTHLRITNSHVATFKYHNMVNGQAKCLSGEPTMILRSFISYFSLFLSSVIPWSLLLILLLLTHTHTCTYEGVRDTNCWAHRNIRTFDVKLNKCHSVIPLVTQFLEWTQGF